MAEVKWIKIVTDVFDDEKILMIETMPDADTIIVIWFKLLCLAGKQNNSGVFQMGQMPYTDEMFSTIFRRPLNTVRLALKTFEQFGMVEIINSTVTIPNWEKHQSLDAYEMAKEKTRKRVAAHRERQKAIAGSVTGNVTDSVTVTACNGTDKIRKEENRKEEIRVYDANEEPSPPPRTKRFIPPTVEEVTSYCASRCNSVDPQRFVDYYTSNGWKVGKNPMKDWKAAVRTWEQDSRPSGKQKTIWGASGVLGEAEMEAIQRVLREEGGSQNAGTS